MLELQHVRKFYNPRLVLEIPLLRLEKGIYWLKGVNGSGKTTFLKMVTGLLPFEGEISFDAVSLKKSPLAYRRMISWAEAEPLFPEFMTGIEMLLLYKDIRGAKREEIDQLITSFGLNDYVSNPIGTYSEGMRKKLSLSLAFVGHPSLIALDEPFITLDTNSVVYIRQLITDTFKNKGTTFLVSSHHDPGAGELKTGRELIAQNQTISIAHESAA